MSQQTLIS